MHILTGYYVVSLLLFSAGIYLTFQGFIANKGMMPIRYRDGPVYRFRKVKYILLEERQDYIFSAAGINMNMKKYNTIRKLILFLVLLMGVLNFLKGDILGARKVLMIGLAVYYLSHPAQSVRGRKTLFSYILSALKCHRANAMDEELAGIILQMKNILISSNQQMSANYLLTRIIPFTNLTKKPFTTALRYIRQGESEKAGMFFEELFGTKLGSLFATILIKLDELPASEFKEQLDNIQKKAESERRTRKEKRRTRVNSARYIVAMIQGFVIAVIFMYLLVIDSIKTLELIR